MFQSTIKYEGIIETETKTRQAQSGIMPGIVPLKGQLIGLPPFWEVIRDYFIGLYW